MTTLFSYLLTFLGIIFWFFRMVVAINYQMEREFFATPLNQTIEIVVLFASLPCILLVIKRNLIGAAAYFGIYGAYFGTSLYEAFVNAQEVGYTVVNAADLICLVAGVVIPLLTFLDVLLNKHRGNFGADMKTRWFYTNDKYDREFDERADRNQYRL